MKKLVLGANGPIGSEIYNVLKSEGKEVVRFGRSKINADDYVVGDALDKEDLVNAARGCDTIYNAIGLKYDAKEWQEKWPTIIKNTIEAARANDARIVFFDNIYLYGPSLDNPIREDHNVAPVSEKGKVRETIYNLLTEAMKDVDIVILRASDFFGPKAKLSVIHASFLESMLEGKSHQFIGSKDKKHSYSYTVDLARAIVLVGEDPSAYNQVWHLPCYQTGSAEEIANAYNKELGTKIKLKTLNKTPHRILGTFIPILKEMHEMRYQFDNDYVLNFDKFKNKYPEFKQTTFEDAIKETVNYFK